MSLRSEWSVCARAAPPHSPTAAPPPPAAVTLHSTPPKKKSTLTSAVEIRAQKCADVGFHFGEVAALTSDGSYFLGP